MSTEAPNESPWYRQFWLWFVLAPPLASIALGISLVTVSVRNSDSMVVGEYSKVGTAMHRYLAKEAQAAQLGVQARLYLDGDGASALLQGLETPPERLFVLLSHPTQGHKDMALTLVRNSGGIYRAEATGWSPGRWYVRIEPEDREWRLSGELGDDRQELSLIPAPVGQPGSE